MKGLSFRGGVHPLHDQHEGKDATKALPLVTFSASAVVIPMRQNIGAECAPLVKKGDTVAIGQRIGEGKGFVSAPVHASVSGTVVAVERRPHISGTPAMSVVIENDGLNTMDESVEPKGSVDSLKAEEIRQIIWDAGIVGMGGATFPTHVKLSVKDDTSIDLIIINGAECEPYLTADHRVMLEDGASIVNGCKAMMKAVGAPTGIIAIEDNKPDAAAAMEKACAGEKSITVKVVQTKYPQGGEKQLIRALTGREVPEGGLPSAVGVVVCNASTSAAVSDAIYKGLPLVWRACTVTGAVTNPQNLKLPIGTLIQDAINFCGGFAGMPKKVLAGGPMMGTAVSRVDVPLTKGSNGITVLGEDKQYVESNCMRCGRCVEACPMQLMPQTINAAYNKGDLDKCETLHAASCISCGCCTYICPARRNLAQTADLAKRALLARARR